jgi:energy-coupling factor transport system ATP-binding protein
LGIIELKNVSFDYESDNTLSRGVKNLSLTIEKGSFVVLLGHNGSGKSTLAKLLNGFLLPGEGDVFINGINTKEKERIFEIRTKVGLVFQNPDNQMVASIIEDDLAFGPENLGIPRDEIIKRVDWALDAVKMSEYRSGTPYKLSGGQKQRIAIAAILAMLPEILILDEATAMLDPRGRAEVMETAKRLNKENKMTVIHITHYMDEAIDADEVIVLNDGEIAIQGSPEFVFGHPEIIKEAGLELPTATKVAGLLREKGFDIPLVLRDEELAEAVCQLR